MTRRRSLAVLAAALAIGLLAAAAASDFASLSGPKACAPGASGSSAATYAANCKAGLTLGLGIASQTVILGNNETITVFVQNDLPSYNTANFTGFPALPYGVDPNGALPSAYLLPEPAACGFTFGALAYFVVYNASHSPVQLDDYRRPPVMCPYVILDSFRFAPSQRVGWTFALGGYYTSPNEPWLNATYHQFGPGEYTVVAFDLWGDVAALNFTVAPGELYLTASGICTVGAAYEPCWGSDQAYVFNCAGAAPEGCTQRVVSTIAPYPSYVVNVKYPFANQTEPSWSNCLWTVEGASPEQGYAVCSPVNSTAFMVGTPGPPHP
ncbi:MAG: hypothetical protein JRN39_00140 [Nitrososphaerota archaeon]|nr:hypothetical protein [Nitrososphaerota archaeon]MDG6938805.1 hypothetical protein [Nitrososphaerota archaeon]